MHLKTVKHRQSVEARRELFETVVDMPREEMARLIIARLRPSSFWQTSRHGRLSKTRSSAAALSASNKFDICTHLVSAQMRANCAGSIAGLSFT